ncbi:MAG: hypothetical protein IKM66_07740 [Clostridia bacterium]|nr:hypothetical protein [Clostridia bacterium]
MKKTAVIFLALIAAITIFFTGCNRDNDNNLMNDNTSTSNPASTSQTATNMSTTDNRDDNAGAPESTSQDSALGDAVGDVADGIGDAADDIGDAADRAGNNIAGRNAGNTNNTQNNNR